MSGRCARRWPVPGPRNPSDRTVVWARMQPTRPLAAAAPAARPRPSRPVRRARRLGPAGLLAAVALATLIAACGGSAQGGSPGASAAPSASSGAGGSGVVESGLAAVEAIRDRVSLFDGFGIKKDDMIGQASWWTADPVGQDWRVVFETGWGDCQAGCIDRHRWTWMVKHDGTLVFGGEEGSALTEDILAGLKASGQNRTGLAGRASGGPTCPVERPDDPACAPRLVGNVELAVKDSSGKDVAHVTTDGSGFFRLELAPGDYVLEAPQVEGFMSGPASLPFTVTAGAEAWLDVSYDTGIR